MKHQVVPHVTIAVWERLFERLCLEVRPAWADSRLFHRLIVRKRHDSASQLDGIVSFLTSKYGGNVHDYGIVDVTSSSCCGNAYPKNAADLLVDSKFGSQGRPDQWLCYEFKTGTIMLTGYTIRSQYDVRTGACHPKDWIIEISMDGSNWTTVDEKTNNGALNEQNAVAYFDVAEGRHRECRFVRLRQTGNSHSGTDALYLSSFEVFGHFFGNPIVCGSDYL
jgi:hypothetical protein